MQGEVLVFQAASSFWMGGGLESHCVGRVYGADGAVRVARYHPHRTHDNKLVCLYSTTLRYFYK
jgi:hypothetical protein